MKKEHTFVDASLGRRIIDRLLINQPVQDPLWRSLHDQNMTRGIVFCFMDRELGKRGEYRQTGEDITLVFILKLFAPSSLSLVVFARVFRFKKKKAKDGHASL